MITKKHLKLGESDSQGLLKSCCGKDLPVSCVFDTRRYVTCKKCLSVDDKVRRGGRTQISTMPMWSKKSPAGMYKD